MKVENAFSLSKKSEKDVLKIAVVDRYRDRSIGKGTLP